jgi:hypothetical protein
MSEGTHALGAVRDGLNPDGAWSRRTGSGCDIPSPPSVSRSVAQPRVPGFPDWTVGNATLRHSNERKA